MMADILRINIDKNDIPESRKIFNKRIRDLPKIKMNKIHLLFCSVQVQCNINLSLFKFCRPWQKSGTDYYFFLTGSYRNTRS